MMKLYIDQIDGDGARCKAFKIYNERGEELPGVYRASVHHDIEDAARLELSLVVNGQDIVFGKPPEKPKLPPDWGGRLGGYQPRGGPTSPPDNPPNEGSGGRR